MKLLLYPIILISVALQAQEIAPLLPDLVFVRGSEFVMGSDQGYDDEKPAHKVKVGDYYLGKFEVTFEEFDRFCEATKARKPEDDGKGRGRRPVINVTWRQANAYCEWLSKQSGKSFRLPSEAEWEFAARGGTRSGAYKYPGGNKLASLAWFNDGESKDGVHPVGSKAASELGFYDLSGNALEWCIDYYGETYYAQSPAVNPKGPDSGSERVLRGRVSDSNDFNCRITVRDKKAGFYKNNYTGFRVAREP